MEQFKSEYLKYAEGVPSDCRSEVMSRDTYDILKGLEHISAQLVEMDTPSSIRFPLKASSECDHSRRKVGGRGEIKECIDCGMQFNNS